MDASAGTQRRYRDIDMPNWFVLEVSDVQGGWIDYGLYEARAFDRLKDGTYLCRPVAGSPLYLRCLQQRDDLIDVVDGAGDRFTYRLVPFPGLRYHPHAIGDMSRSHGEAPPRPSAH